MTEEERDPLQLKVVFVVTSQGNDFYSAMTRVAMASLRLSNPELRVVVACDRESDGAMLRASDPLVDDADEWLAVDTPPGNAGFRNRYVKTSLCSLIDGAFLFLDSDIFVRGDLSEIFRLDIDIAGARNHSQPDIKRQIWDRDLAALDAMCWTIGSEVYLNGGVLFCNDTPAARQFWAEWHRRWLRSCSELGSYRDQPALNSALYDTHPRLTVLPDRFNAQFKKSPRVASNAVLWHYYFSVGGVPCTPFELLVNAITRGGKVDAGKIASMKACNHPWHRETSIDDLAAAGVMRRGCFDGWEAAWLRREKWRYGRYILARAGHVMGLLRRETIQG